MKFPIPAYIFLGLFVVAAIIQLFFAYHLDENDLAHYFCSKDAEITVSFGNGNTRKLKIMAFGEMPEKYQSGRYFEMGFNVIVPSSSFDEAP